SRRLTAASTASALLLAVSDRPRRLSLPSETHVIVRVQQVEPRHNILAGGGSFLLQFGEVFARFRVSRCAPFGKFWLRRNRRFSALALGVLLDPGQDLGITLAVGQMFLESLRVDTHKIQEALVQRAGVLVFALLAGDDSAAFVQ